MSDDAANKTNQSCVLINKNRNVNFLSKNFPHWRALVARDQCTCY